MALDTCETTLLRSEVMGARRGLAAEGVTTPVGARRIPEVEGTVEGTVELEDPDPGTDALTGLLALEVGSTIIAGRTPEDALPSLGGAVGSDGGTTMVLAMMTVVTLGMLSGFDAEPAAADDEELVEVPGLCGSGNRSERDCLLVEPGTEPKNGVGLGGVCGSFWVIVAFT